MKEKIYAEKWKKAQTSTEFILIFSFFLFGAIVILALASQNVATQVNYEKFEKIRYISQYIGQELTDAALMGEGYEKKISDPAPKTKYLAVLRYPSSLDDTVLLYVYEDIDAIADIKETTTYYSVAIPIAAGNIKICTESCGNPCLGAASEVLKIKIKSEGGTVKLRKIKVESTDIGGGTYQEVVKICQGA